MAWLLGILIAAGVIYCIGAIRFNDYMEDGRFGISPLEVALLAPSVMGLCLLVTRCWKYFDPYPEVRISPGTACLGTSLDVEWTFRGSKRRLRGVAIALEGREEVWAENKTGTLAGAQKLAAPFYVQPLEMPKRPGQGQVHVELPAGLMPTFAAQKTKIVWLLRFENQIRWGAKIKYEFPVQVLPEAPHG